jgi:hypothetical protein
MASNFTKRLDRLERLIRERALASTHPLYFRDGDSIPDGIDPHRVIFIKREHVDPPQRGEEFLPEVSEEAAANLFGADSRRPARFGRPLNLPVDGIA